MYNTPIHFITGVPKSGTTLLGQLLSNSKDVAYFYELTVASYLLNKTHSHFSIKHSNIDESILNISYRKSIECFYNNAATSVFGKRRMSQVNCIIDKDPAILPHINKITEILPSTKIIHIIRDPYCVCASYVSKINSINESDLKRSWGKIDNDCEDDDEPHIRAAKIWKRYASNTDLYKSQIFNKRYFEVKYEDLVQNPLQTCNAILSFLNLHKRIDPLVVELANVNMNKNADAKRTLTDKQINDIAAIIK